MKPVITLIKMLVLLGLLWPAAIADEWFGQEMIKGILGIYYVMKGFP